MNEQGSVSVRKTRQGKKENPDTRGAQTTFPTFGESKRESMAGEEWRAVIGYEGFYEVSSLGRIRSLDRTSRHPRNGINATKLWRGRILRPTIGKIGYYTVALSKNGKRSHRTVHQLVCDAFYPGVKRQCTNHKNGIKLDNRIANIEPASFAENQRHARRTGLIQPIKWSGERSVQARLTETAVLDIRRRRKNGEMVKTLAAEYKMSPEAVSHITNGRTWKHLL